VTVALPDRRVAALVALGMFAVYNANGREIPSFDSQPTKFAARELLLRGTLSLNHVVGAAPLLRDRHGFRLARDGRYRSAYSPLPAVLAAGIMWPFWATGVVDVRAPLAPGLIAAAASSLLVSVAVALAFLLARLDLPRGRALILAVGLGLGTGLWSTVSQTMWQHETAIFGFALTVLSLTLIDRSAASRGWPAGRGRALSIAVGIGLGLAAGSRLQLAPAVAVLMLTVLARSGWRAAVVSGMTAAAIVAPVLVTNVQWFGHVLGAAPMLVALQDGIHGTQGTFRLSPTGFAGLLVSPSRGLLVYSPVVLVAGLGIPALIAARRTSPLVGCTLAALAQYTLYATYVVWWGGHTYGPRYLLDVLPLLLPLAVAGMAALHGSVRTTLGGAALAWSIGVAGLGAFCYPDGRWNNDPSDVDRHHERLWDWRDTQIRRTWQAGPSVQNFSLLDVYAVRTRGDR
jgi:hypothetical protein